LPLQKKGGGRSRPKVEKKKKEEHLPAASSCLQEKKKKGGESFSRTVSTKQGKRGKAGHEKPASKKGKKKGQSMFFVASGPRDGKGEGDSHSSVLVSRGVAS